MDSTLRSNLTVGLPLDLLIYETGSHRIGLQQRITEEDPAFQTLRNAWSEALQDAYRRIPTPGWLSGG
jgi:putative proteasome-type protease